MSHLIPVGISSRHLHVHQQDLETLFGKGHSLTKTKDLSQTGQYACEETVTLVTCKSQIEKVRILGPVRKDTQVELSLTDCIKLGIQVPIRESGNLEGTPGIQIIGPSGKVLLESGVIVAARHIHMSPKDAERFCVEPGEIVSAYVSGPRSITFNQVVIRIREDFVLDFHIDTDEANAANLKNGDTVELIKLP